ncbi:uncharacterized protein AMSG_06325 [Thecamonas trahens ATCC 50062]|uniref:Uncharacterized protein n=1 Tax=Thecamonas trahens ATCC 50062 TaxID=461836 RepID=A0A0L0DFT5_THETB|nr:hypothetical protein AMSG_06325 [Thecamonas trahens ATCC 50062]KNC50183.1 hypothetical protein AMSG_06325 [Thecamonas trahens ATCC 50062]|eukprot:XP_013757020.1 hypothetical protein AMSG_06325 [Thecamonas trahens ATCC 50062]
MTSVQGPGRGCWSEAVAGDNNVHGCERQANKDGKQDDDAVVVLEVVADGVGEEVELAALDGKGEEGKAGEQRGCRCRRRGLERRRRRWRTRRGVGERMLRRVARAEWRRACGGGSGDILDSIGAMAASKSETNQVLLNEMAKQIKDLENAIAKQATEAADTIRELKSTIAKQATEAADTIRERERTIRELRMQLASAGITPVTMATNDTSSSQKRTTSEGSSTSSEGSSAIPMSESSSDCGTE